MNTFTLWRADTLLGRFEDAPLMHHGRRVGASGILEPTVAEGELPSVMQTRIRIFPGRPVFQSPMDPVVLGDHSPRRSTNNTGALQELSEEEAKGVPPNLVLSVRDGSDVTIDADMIVLSLTVIPDDVDLATVSAARGRTITSRRHWNVSFACHDEATR